MKNVIAGFFVGLLILVLGVIAYLSLGLADIRSDARMPAWAARLSYTGLHASVRRSAPKARNPMPARDETLIAGEKLYLDDCVGCHGEPGKPPSEFGASFYPPAPQFPIAGTQYSESEIFWIAKHGIRRTGMAAQAGSYNDQQIWSLAAFIARMSRLPAAVAQAIQQKAAK